MGHRVIIIDSATPTDTTAAASSHDGEHYTVRVQYQPSDAATPAQIGNEVARIQRLVNRLIEGTAD